MTKTNKIINMGVIAHINAGKTTTVENILYRTGSIRHKGDVEEGTSTTDFLVEEKDHGITIKSSVVNCNINDLKLNIIDTPGHIDFSIEVQRILNVIDFALVIIDANHGVQAQTEFLFNLARNNKKPMIFFLNKVDKHQFSFDKSIENIEKALKIKLLPITFPHYEKNELSKIVSIIQKNEDNYYKEIIDIYIENIINSIDDDKLIEDFINNRFEPVDLIKKIDCVDHIPIFSGSSKKNIGLDLLIDTIYNLSDNFLSFTKKKIDSFYTFKYFPNYEEDLFYCNVLSDEINKNDILSYQNNINNKFTLKNIYNPFGINLNEIEKAFFNDIVVVSYQADEQNRLQNGDIISKSIINDQILKNFKIENSNMPIILMNINFEDEDSLNKFLLVKDKIILDDPSLSISYNSELDQYVVGGIGELQLEIFKEKLSHHYNINIRLNDPKVAYKTNIDNNTIEISDSLMFCNTEIKISFQVEIKFSESQISKLILPFNTINYDFPIFEYPIIYNDFIINNFRIDNYQSKDSFSNEMITNFVINLLNKNLKNIKPNILEPIMLLEIKTNHNYTGIITTDLQKKDGEILNIEYTDDFDIILSEVPFRNLIGFTTHFRDITNGRAFFTMKLLKYKNAKNLKTDQM